MDILVGFSVGLPAHNMSDMGWLAKLAVNPQGTSREEIYLAVASLYRAQGAALNPRERALMHEILRRLTRDVAIAIRIALADLLADDTAAPHELVLLLADDTVEVARPLLLRSPLLTDTDFLSLLAATGEAHHETVAWRENIGEPVTDALSRSEVEAVLVALVCNTTARISPTIFETLVEKSRHLENLQEPLTRRLDLPPLLANRMCGWMTKAPKTCIIRNHQIAPDRQSAAMAKTVVTSEPAAPSPLPEGSAQKLIDKLAASGQLKAGFLMRVLHQGQSDLFDLGLARLVNLPPAELHAKFYGEPRAVALACRAVGIDRCVFNTVFNLSRQSHDMRAALGPRDIAEVDGVFKNFAKPAALAELARMPA
ncbi:MAG TPA: DUF2336 domain-containing protein [Rhizomicrobium sp.]|nr:DUF2336 domain-containing protein [Rhizomicrobium sp.]